MSVRIVTVNEKEDDRQTVNPTARMKNSMEDIIQALHMTLTNIEYSKQNISHFRPGYYYDIILVG